MLKRISAALALVVFVSALAFAAPVTVKGKVASIDGNKVQVTFTGEAAAWAKKGAGVKIGTLRGKIVEVTDTTLTFTSKKASELQVGQEVTLEKGPAAMVGC
jgi:hypothetical protein